MLDIQLLVNEINVQRDQFDKQCNPADIKKYVGAVFDLCVPISKLEVVADYLEMNSDINAAHVLRKNLEEVRNAVLNLLNSVRIRNTRDSDFFQNILAVRVVNLLICATQLKSLMPDASLTDEAYYPATYYIKFNIQPDTLRKAAGLGRINRRKGNGNRNHYCDADVRKCWPDAFDS